MYVHNYTATPWVRRTYKYHVYNSEYPYMVNAVVYSYDNVHDYTATPRVRRAYKCHV